MWGRSTDSNQVAQMLRHSLANTATRRTSSPTDWRGEVGDGRAEVPGYRSVSERSIGYPHGAEVSHGPAANWSTLDSSVWALLESGPRPRRPGSDTGSCDRPDVAHIGPTTPTEDIELRESLADIGVFASQLLRIAVI